MKVSANTLREVEEALDRYRKEVVAAKLARATEKTYLLHSENFVRWLKDEFEPGARLK
jgi:hypothetical protein